MNASMSREERFEQVGLLQIEQGEALGDDFAHPELAATRRTYGALRQALTTVGEEASPPAGWEARVFATIARRKSARRRGGWLRLLIPAGAAAALAALLLVGTPPGPDEGVATLTVRVEAGAGPARRGSEAHPGDRLRLEARTGDAAHAELRVYRSDRELVLRCSTAPPCVRQGQTLRADVPLPALGTYQSLLLLSDSPLPAPAGTLDADAGSALEAGAHVTLGDEVSVQ